MDQTLSIWMVHLSSIGTLFMVKVFETETISEIIADAMEFFLEILEMPRVSSSNAAILSAPNLLEALTQPTPNAPFATINDTNRTTLRNLEGLFNFIPRVEEQQ